MTKGKTYKLTRTVRKFMAGIGMRSIPKDAFQITLYGFELPKRFKVVA